MDSRAALVRARRHARQREREVVVLHAVARLALFATRGTRNAKIMLAWARARAGAGIAQRRRVRRVDDAADEPHVEDGRGAVLCGWEKRHFAACGSPPKVSPCSHSTRAAPVYTCRWWCARCARGHLTDRRRAARGGAEGWWRRRGAGSWRSTDRHVRHFPRSARRSRGCRPGAARPAARPLGRHEYSPTPDIGPNSTPTHSLDAAVDRPTPRCRARHASV